MEEKFCPMDFVGKTYSLFLAVSIFFLGTILIKPAFAATTLTVCPTGTPGQNGCDYIGGDGIQAAVDAAPVGSSQ